jgi:Cdc6-like AAA superfamily ATPase
MAEPSHKDCVHRQDYDALMRHLNNARMANYALANQLREAQDALARVKDVLPREEVRLPKNTNMEAHSGITTRLRQGATHGA